MKKFLVLVMILVSIPCYAENSKIEVRGSIDDGEDVISSTGLLTSYFSSGNVQQQTISLDSNTTFTNIVIPLGAKAILIDVMSSDGIKLKGASADVGISLDRTTPVLLPISRDGSVTTTIGIQNLENNSNKIRVFFY